MNTVEQKFFRVTQGRRFVIGQGERKHVFDHRCYGHGKRLSAEPCWTES